MTRLFADPRKPKPPRKWRVFYIFRTAIRRTCTAIGAVFLFSALLGSVLVLLAKEKTVAPLPDKIVLYLPLEQDFAEYQSTAYGFGTHPLTVRQFVDALDFARTDERVKGFITVIKGGALNITHIQEARAAIRRFRDSGKFAYIYAPSYGEVGTGLGTYYLASAFDEIWMQPLGTLSVAGIKAEIPFARGVLEKIGVEPQFFARKEYKSLFESFTATEMSAASREATTAMIQDMADNILGDIAADRQLTPATLRRYVDRGLFIDHESLSARLIDRLDYLDVLDARIKKDVTKNPDSNEDIFVQVGRYANSIENEAAAGVKDKPRVALVYVVGTIRASDKGGGYGGKTSSAEDISSLIMDAADDDDIAVIIMRINSPGGSPTASETIRRAVIKAQNKGKLVVVSMGGMAASGGYWIASPADYIFALPATLTGSIGVAGGKFSLQGAWEKAGINWDSVQIGRNAGMLSVNEPFTDTGAERMNAVMDSIYNGFIERVAKGRYMTLEETDKVARGRVWTGNQALDKGLVDNLGGLDAALDYAAYLAGVTSRDYLDIVILPKPKTPLEEFMDFMETQASIGDFLKIQATFTEIFKPLTDAYLNSDLLVLERLEIL